MTKVTFGYIFRALHHWGAHMMVAAVFLHMMRVYFVGAYKNPRELNWLLGVILLNVTLLFGYTGYLLPWDQLSFWAGQIGLEMANTIPVIGEIIGNMLFGGPELSGATIIRMYYLHVFVLPLVGGALMVLHMAIVWMQGVAEPH
jgi:quinol-cytochrome oxidoreductase complex cytochrome b subunit